MRTCYALSVLSSVLSVRALHNSYYYDIHSTPTILRAMLCTLATDYLHMVCMITKNLSTSATNSHNMLFVRAA